MRKRILIIITFLLAIISCSKDNESLQNNNNGNVEDPINVNLNRQPVGSSANDLLSDRNFTSMIVEIAYVEGFAPSQATINNFVNFIEARTFKPNGVTVEQRVIPSSGNTNLTIQQVADIEIEYRQNYNTEDQIAVWAFFADAEAESNNGNSFTLGSAYWNTSFVIYQETVQNFSGGTFQPSQTLLESTVINHEFGHILGLVDLGSDMQQNHEDESNPKHCDVDSCLMFWAVESSAGVDNMLGMDTPPSLDAQCIADLQANGGR